MTFPVTRSGHPAGLRPDAVPVASDTPASRQSASARNVKLLEQRDQAASAMLRSLLSSPPPAVVAGARSRQKAAPVHEEVLLADSGGRDFGGDNDTDWTGLDVINAFRPNASRINDEFPDYFTFYAQDAVRDAGGYLDSKSAYKNGTVSTAVGNYTSPYEFATALRKAVISTCGSQLSKGMGTPTYDLAESFGVEVFAWDQNTAVGIGGPRSNSSIGLNTIMTGCVRLAYESMTALPRGIEAGRSKGDEGFWSVENSLAVAVGAVLGLGVLYLCARAETGSVMKTLKSLNPCAEPAERQDDHFDGNDYLAEMKNGIRHPRHAINVADEDANPVQPNPVPDPVLPDQALPNQVPDLELVEDEPIEF